MSFKSDRLSFGPHVIDDLDCLYGWKNDPQILAMSSDDVSQESIEQTRSSLQRWTKGGGDDIIHLALRLRTGDGLIGFAHIAFIDHFHKRCKLGLVIGRKDLWGRGLGTEAIRAICAFSFSELQMHRISAEAYSTNPRAQGALLAAGFVREGVLRESILRSGRFIDEYAYGILRRDWEEVR